MFFSGQSFSLMGTWMQRTAVYWVIYIQTHSAFILGLSVFAIQFPTFIFSLLGGTIADRYSRYKVLLVTQVASMIQAILLTLIIVFTKYSVPEILFLSVILGVINAFDVPARQSLVQDMVENKEDLGNAIALNSSMVQVAKLVGPAIAGIVLELFGAGVCFLINALSFVAVIVSLLMMRLPKYIPQEGTKKVIEGLKEGITYLKSAPSIGAIVLLLSFTSFLVIPYVTLLPIVAKISLHGNASTYGYLFSASGIGGIIGAIFLASLKHEVNLRKVLFFALLIFGLGLILFSQTQNIFFALIFATISGFGMMSLGTITNTILQTSSTKEMRGRIMSYYAMAFFGMQPIGALMIGSISHYVGTSETIFAQGIAAIIIAAIFFRKLWKSESDISK